MNENTSRSSISRCVLESEGSRDRRFSREPPARATVRARRRLAAKQKGSASKDGPQGREIAFASGTRPEGLLRWDVESNGTGGSVPFCCYPLPASRLVLAAR